jgi:hypothetical protein
MFHKLQVSFIRIYEAHLWIRKPNNPLVAYTRNQWESHHHTIVCLTICPQSLPQRVLHRMRASASFFNFQYPLSSLRSSCNCLLLLPRRNITSNLPYIAPSTCFRRQFLPKIWPIHLAFFLFIVCRIPLSSLTLCNTSLFFTRSIQLIFSVLLQHQISGLPRYEYL